MAHTPVIELARVYLDTETTGLDAREQEIIEIAIIREYPDGRMTEWSSKVKPTRLETAHPKALEVNGYAAHPEDWNDAPTFDEVAAKVADLLTNCIVIGHNVGFDVDFVQEALKRAKVEARISYHKVDTVTLAYTVLVPCGLTSLSLDNIRHFLGWSKDKAHTALKDTKDAQRLYHLLSRATVFHRLWWRMTGKTPPAKVST